MTDTGTLSEQEGRPYPIPPATFEFLTESLRLQAEMQLGLMHMGEEKSPPELDLARHTIDLMAMLQEKTRGNLTLEEQRFLDNSLTLLRFRYVQVLEETKKPGTPADSPQPETAQADSQKA